MKNKRFHFKVLALLPLLAIAFSREKLPEPEPENQEPVMPPLTRKGENTFGCYLDGELFVASKGQSPWDIPPLSGSFNEETKLLSFQGTRYTGEVTDYIVMFAKIDRGSDSYIYEIFDGDIIGYRNLGGDKCDYFYESVSSAGELRITYLNESQNIISGTFNINLNNEGCSDDIALAVTDGRFDFRY